MPWTMRCRVFLRGMPLRNAAHVRGAVPPPLQRIPLRKAGGVRGAIPPPLQRGRPGQESGWGWRVARTQCGARFAARRLRRRPKTPPSTPDESGATSPSEEGEGSPLWREAVLQRHPLQRGRPGGGAAAPVPNAGRASPRGNSAGGPEHPHPLRFAPGLPPLKRGKDIHCGSKPFAEGVPTRGGAARRPPRNHPPLPTRTERSGDPGARGHRKSRAGRPWAPEQVRGGNRVGISRDWIGAVAGPSPRYPSPGHSSAKRRARPLRYTSLVRGGGQVRDAGRCGATDHFGLTHEPPSWRLVPGSRR